MSPLAGATTEDWKSCGACDGQGAGPCTSLSAANIDLVPRHHNSGGTVAHRPRRNPEEPGGTRRRIAHRMIRRPAGDAPAAGALDRGRAWHRRPRDTDREGNGYHPGTQRKASPLHGGEIRVGSGFPLSSGTRSKRRDNAE
jgi:hypothetical protein